MTDSPGGLALETPIATASLDVPRWKKYLVHRACTHDNIGPCKSTRYANSLALQGFNTVDRVFFSCATEQPSYSEAPF